jgi:hypothetical protein
MKRFVASISYEDGKRRFEASMPTPMGRDTFTSQSLEGLFQGIQNRFEQLRYTRPIQMPPEPPRRPQTGDLLDGVFEGIDPREKEGR